MKKPKVCQKSGPYILRGLLFGSSTKILAKPLCKYIDELKMESAKRHFFKEEELHRGGNDLFPGPQEPGPTAMGRVPEL